MAVTAAPYGSALSKALNKETDWDSDAIKCMLTLGYTPDPATHVYKSSVTGEISGTGYSAGGVALTSLTNTYTAANSWGTSRANSTAYATGAVVRPATGNLFLYQASTGGTSGGSIPTYPTTLGSTVTDGSVVWTCVGRGATVLDSADPSWTSATLSADTAVFYDSTPATDATRPLISYVSFGGTVSSTASTYTITLDPNGVLIIFT